MPNESPGEVPSEVRGATSRPPRHACPRCGAALGTLAAPHESVVEREGRASARSVPEPSALYCGCCGLVVSAT
jgi:hypothetical protein